VKIRTADTLLQTLRNSLLVQLGLAVGLLATLSFLSIVISAVVAENISGKANAINIAGSLRMMSFRMLSETAQPEKRPQVADSAAQFERRLLGLDHFLATKSAGDTASQRAVSQIVGRWSAYIRPLLLAAATGEVDAFAQAARDIPVFVGQIDQLVLAIEEDLENKVRWLRITQLVLLAVIVAVCLLTSWILRQRLAQPLAHLLKAANTVAGGSFSTRVSHVSDDELGRLGQAFNTMVGEIANMYAHLADKVDEKTRELTRSNQSLELLYRTSQRLSASDLTLDQIEAVLRDIEQALELGHSMICISEHGQLPAQPVIGDLDEAERRAWCGQHDCATCFAHAGRDLAEQHGDMLILPIGDSMPLQGTLPIRLRGDAPLPREKLRLIETVGHHVSNALANMRRAEEKHRLAVLEERSAIARELHDSIAQSLSYLKIQVTRLEKTIESGGDARTISDELKRGLNAAYRELRELITTFRLRIDERGFAVALQETVVEFSAKLGFPVGLNNPLAGIALSANEEMHVIRIVREALSNIERHADARSAEVDIEIGPERRVRVRVRDDGRGFDPADTPANHFGTSIMRDRAQLLGGRLDIASRPGAGTVIELQFLPLQYRQTAQERNPA